MNDLVKEIPMEALEMESLSTPSVRVVLLVVLEDLCADAAAFAVGGEGAGGIGFDGEAGVVLGELGGTSAVFGVGMGGDTSWAGLSGSSSDWSRRGCRTGGGGSSSVADP